MLTNNSSFTVRLISSIGIVLYFLILFIFSWLGDLNNNWSPVSEHYRNAFAWLTLITLIPIIILATMEINHIHYRGVWKSYIVALVLILCLTLIPSIICIYCQYFYHGNKTFIFLLTMIIVYTFVNLVLFSYYKFLKLPTTDVFILLFIVNIFSLFINSFVYVSVVKAWSTLLIIFLLPVLNDTFAYLGGRLLGRRKLSPFISPKKTIEGAIVGIIVSVGLSLLLLTSYSFASNSHHMTQNFLGVEFVNRFNSIFNDEFSSKPLWWVNSTIIIIVLSIFSIIGDLSFSAIKRRYDIKDFSSIIPGHGGVLDRFDSHTFVYTLYFIISVGIGFFDKSVSVF